MDRICLPIIQVPIDTGRLSSLGLIITLLSESVECSSNDGRLSLFGRLGRIKSMSSLGPLLGGGATRAMRRRRRGRNSSTRSVNLAQSKQSQRVLILRSPSLGFFGPLILACLPPTRAIERLESHPILNINSSSSTNPSLLIHHIPSQHQLPPLAHRTIASDKLLQSLSHLPPSAISPTVWRAHFDTWLPSARTPWDNILPLSYILSSAPLTSSQLCSLVPFSLSVAQRHPSLDDPHLHFGAPPPHRLSALVCISSSRPSSRHYILNR